MLSAMLYSGSKIRSAKRASLAGALAILINSLADGSLVSTDLLLVQPQVLTVLAACDPLMLMQSSHQAVFSGVPVAHASVR